MPFYTEKQPQADSNYLQYLVEADAPPKAESIEVPEQDARLMREHRFGFGVFEIINGKFVENTALSDSLLHSADALSARKKEYPSVEDQLDMIFHDQKNGTTQWMDTILSIKTKHPKV